MLDLFKESSEHISPISQEELNDEEVLNQIATLKSELSEKVIFLGHHYQNDDIISFADITGDSLKLAKEAAKIKQEYVIFCGVHFMAETADILTENKTVILPDLKAGCSMADMANDEQVNECWKYLNEATNEKIIPITYINCTASLKSFVGKNGGSICTSSNAKQVITWAFKEGQKLLFFPDQHLGRNTCYDLGIPLDEMVTYHPQMQNGGLTKEQIQNAKVILWYGYCSVHQGFTVSQVEQIKKEEPNRKVIVHPECNFEVVQAADDSGSTSYIIDQIKNAPPKSSFAVGTEVNLVNRLNQSTPDKDIISLSPYQCLCTTMYRVRPRWLLSVLKSIKNNKPINVIKVSNEVKKFSKIALDRMLNIV